MKIVLVDENDRIIGQKKSDNLKAGDIYRVSALWITNKNNQILLAQRQLGKRNDPGKWGPAVSGTVEAGEDYEQNVYKEAWEEIGLNHIKFLNGPKILNGFGAHKFFVQWFTCVIDWPIEKFKIQQDEVKQLAWVDKAELLKGLSLNPDKYIAGAEKVWSEFI